MVVWQFKIELIPKAWIEEPGNNIDMLYDQEGSFDTSSCWKNHQPSNIESFCNNLLPETSSWSEDIRIWGNEESTDLKVLYENGKVEEVSTIRLDLREISANIIKNVLEFIQSLNCYIFLPEQKEIIESEISLLCNKISISNAYKFVKDPLGFLEEIKKQPNH